MPSEKYQRRNNSFACPVNLVFIQYIDLFWGSSAIFCFGSFFSLSTLGFFLSLYCCIFSGKDIPSNEQSQMYPVDRIVPAGANTTFCCIVKEGSVFDKIKYSSTVMNATRLSRRSYAATAVNQEPSGTSGTNVVCRVATLELNSGTVVFVGCKMKRWVERKPSVNVMFLSVRQTFTDIVTESGWNESAQAKSVILTRKW